MINKLTIEEVKTCSHCEYYNRSIYEAGVGVCNYYPPNGKDYNTSPSKSCAKWLFKISIYLEAINRWRE